MKKHIFSLLSVLLCAALLAAPVTAASDDDAYKLYKNAMKKMESVTSTEITGTVNVGVDMGSVMNMDITSKVSASQLIKDGDVQMSMHMTMEELGMSSDIYYKDGYYYQNTDGDKRKLKMSFDQAKENTGTFNYDYDFTKSMFKDATVEKVADGTSIKLKISSKDANETFGAMLNSTYEQMGILDDDMKLGAITYTMVIGDDGNLKSSKMSFSGTTEIEGITMKMKFKLNYKIKSIDKITSISFPSDLSSYKSY